MSSTPPTSPGIAPADARPHRRWPVWATILVYLFFIALAIVSVWFIDRRVDALAGS